MADNVLVGAVRFLTITRGSAHIEMTDADGVREKLQLWGVADGGTPGRNVQVAWAGLCQDSLTSGNELMVATESMTSAQVVSIRMAPAPVSRPTDLTAALISLLL